MVVSTPYHISSMVSRRKLHNYQSVSGGMKVGVWSVWAIDDGIGSGNNLHILTIHEETI